MESKKVNLTGDLVKKKNSRISKMTVYVNHPFYGFADSDLGISFCRMTKKGIKKDRSGKVKWYFGSNGSLGKAIANANRVYRMKIGRKGWSKVRVKAYNLSDAGEIVAELKSKV